MYKYQVSLYSEQDEIAQYEFWLRPKQAEGIARQEASVHEVQTMLRNLSMVSFENLKARKREGIRRQMPKGVKDSVALVRALNDNPNQSCVIPEAARTHSTLEVRISQA